MRDPELPAALRRGVIALRQVAEAERASVRESGISNEERERRQDAAEASEHASVVLLRELTRHLNRGGSR